MNPAALQAALRGDLANAIIASTPGGIEAQEAAGQRALVSSGANLPKDINYPRDTTRDAITAATGIQFGADADEIFVSVTLPPGWKLRATDHSMWSDLLDQNGCKRAGVFYKAAFYDRKAHISFDARYTHSSDYAKPVSTTTVRDTKTGDVLFTAGQCEYGDYEAQRALEDKARAWLDERYPRHNDPFAYWVE